MADEAPKHRLIGGVEGLGRNTFHGLKAIGRGIEEFGMATALLAESLFWLLLGRFRYQPVRISAIVGQMMSIGIEALPIATVLSLVIGVTLAMQGIDVLREFGAESQVVLGVSISVTREFAPLIMGILVAGRSGAALSARIGTMRISQEIDALQVMGINPVRYLVVPSLVAMVVMLPLLTFWADLMALLGAALYTNFDLGMSLNAYARGTLDALNQDDLLHGIGKSAVFALLIVLVGVINGIAVKGGAEGVGRATTRSVVVSIAGIIITDMLFIFVLTR